MPLDNESNHKDTVCRLSKFDREPFNNYFIMSRNLWSRSSKKTGYISFKVMYVTDDLKYLSIV
jgi:hypothetical protein